MNCSFDDCGVKNLSFITQRIARSYESYYRFVKINVEQTFEYVKIARKLLKKVRVLCEQSFQDADFLLNAVKESINCFEKSDTKVSSRRSLLLQKAMMSDFEDLITHFDH